MSARPRAPRTLAAALAAHGVAEAARAAASVAGDMPPDGTVRPGLGLDRDPAFVAPRLRPSAIAAHGRLVGAADGIHFVAFDDGVLALSMDLAGSGVALRAVSDGDAARAAADIASLAALAGDRWLDDAALRAFESPPATPAWRAVVARVADVLAAAPAAAAGVAEIGEGGEPGDAPWCVLHPEDVGDPAERLLAHLLALHAVAGVHRVGAPWRRPGAHRRLASSWGDGPAGGYVDHPAPTALASAVVAAAVARPARARIVAWLAGEGPASARLLGEVRRRWGGDGAPGP